MRTLRAKIMGGYVLITVLALLVGTLSALNYVRFTRDLDAIMVRNYRSVIAAGNLVASLERQDSAALLMLMGDQESRSLFEQAKVEFMEWLARAQDNVTEPGEGEAVASIRAGFVNYTRSIGQLEQTVGSGGMTGGTAVATYRREVLPHFNATRQACQELLRINDEAMRAKQARTAAASGRAVWSTIGVAASALLLAVVLGSTLSSLIAQPIRRLAEFARRVGEGHLDESLVIKSDDEVGVLSTEFGRMLEHLRELRASDVAQLTATRLKLGAVIESISDGLVVMDTDSRIESANRVANRVFGWHEGEVAGLPFAEAVEDPRLKDLITRATAGSADRAPLAVEATDNGKKRYYHAEATIIRHQGKSLGIVLLMRDVTAVEEEDRARSRFMSAISHELRTPLASLVMGTGLLAESRTLKDSPRDVELVEIIQEDSRRLDRLVDELFALTRLQMGQVPLRFAEEDVAAMVDLATKPFLPQAETAGVELVRDVPDGFPPVRADRDKVAWVLSNLLGNALRYAPAGGRVRISAELHGSMAYLTVEDDGPGIPKESQEAIFEPFVQLDPAKKGGAGLGLPVSRDIVRAHGGRIWVDSEVGRGSKFTFSLPVTKTIPGGDSIGEGVNR
ncbi:MAG TPA: ATP-binding protein [Bacillota bacterium]